MRMSRGMTAHNTLRSDKKKSAS